MSMRDLTDQGSARLARPLGEFVLDDHAAWALLDSSPDGFIVCDEAGTMVFANGQLEKLSGYDRVELLGQAVEVLVPLGVRGPHRAHRTRYRAEPTVRSMGEGRELALRRSNGDEVPVEISLAPVELAGAMYTAVGVRDVTDRRADDRARRRLLALLDQVPDAVMVCRSESTNFEYVNLGAVSLLGYSREELMEMTLRHISPAFPGRGDDRTLSLEAALDLARPMESDLRDRDGSDIECDVRVVMAAEGDDGERSFVVVAEDARERRAWARRLQSSEEAFRTAFEQAPVGMVVTELDHDRTRRVVRANKVFADLLGLSIDELIGLSPSTFSHPDDDLLDQAATQAQLSGEAPSYTLEKRYRRRDGTYVWGELHSSLLRQSGSSDDDSNGRPVARLSHVVDISARRAERERQARAEKLKASINDVAVALFGGADPDAVLNRAANDFAEILDVEGAAVFVRAPSSDRYRLATKVGHLSDEALRPPAVLDESAERRDVALLTSGTDLVGWISVQPSPSRAGLTEHDRELLENYAAQLAPLFELAAARAAQQRLVVLEDRERIARDLHDTVIQGLFAAGMQISAGLSRVPDRELRAKFENVVNQLDDTVRQLRSAVFDLHHVSSAERRDLSVALESILHEANRVLGHEPLFRLVGPLDALDETVAEQLEPTLREALSNVARHARATSTTVTLAVGAEQVSLVIEDDGVGLSPSMRPGNGIRNIKQRALALGGSATLTARADRGCRLEWNIPRNAPRRDRT